ncbi:MAG: disulfide bond formation protein B [Thiohalocapsa sp.]|nr:disulfide bond formation protein B [Thiohalocapsa sp.]
MTCCSGYPCSRSRGPTLLTVFLKAIAIPAIPARHGDWLKPRTISGAAPLPYPFPGELDLTALITHRRLWLLIAGASAALALASILLTEWLALQPCHLCIFQRLLYMLIAPLALAVALTTGLARRIGGALTALAAAAGAATAGYQTWLQRQPEGSVSCIGPDMGPIERFVEWLGMQQPTLFMATGFCEDEALIILGLSLAEWALFCFVVICILALWLLRPHARGAERG